MHQSKKEKKEEKIEIEIQAAPALKKLNVK